jgi:hypothetical protein
LAVSLELAKGSWKLALSDGQRERPAVHRKNGDQKNGDRFIFLTPGCADRKFANPCREKRGRETGTDLFFRQSTRCAERRN